MVGYPYSGGWPHTMGYMWGSLRRKNDNLVKIDLLNLDHTLKSLRIGSLFPIYLSSVEFEKKITAVIQSPEHKEA